MKVGYINQFAFRANSIAPITKPDLSGVQAPENKELPKITQTSRQLTQSAFPDYGVYNYNIKTPQKYTKLGVTEFNNGLKLHSYKLANGHSISIVPMEGSPAVVKNYVNVGALNETDDIKGISHFLEHMAFNGTTGENGYIKLNTGDSFKNIEKLGGWTNASTSLAVTDYINSTPLLEEKDLEEQIKVIAGMTEDLALTPEMIEKEKGPVCSEINMIMDEPYTIANDQTIRTLFNIKSSADDLVGGSTEHIKNLTREKVKEYYDKYYTPDNMNLVITGDVDPDKVIELVAKNFRSTKVSNGNKYEERLVPITESVRKDFITDKTNSALITLAFVGPRNNDAKARVIHNVVSEYLNQTDIGIRKNLKDINAYHYFDIEKVSNNPNNPTMVYFNLDCSEENSEKALKIMFDKLSNVKPPSPENLENIKDRLLQNYKDISERSYSINNTIGNSVLNGNLDFALNYENLLKDITPEDVKNYIDKYIDLNKTALTVIHPETELEQIEKNHFNASKLSFKGKRMPVKTDKVDEITLDNNIKTVFYETNNDNITFDVAYSYKPLLNSNPAISAVLSEILSMGTKYQTEEEFQNYQEKNNIEVYASASSRAFYFGGYSSCENFEKTAEKAKELLYSPRITEETVNKAIENIKDSIGRKEINAYDLYWNNIAKTNPYIISDEKILEGLNNVTVEDVKNFHQYILNNSKASITINNPKNNDIKDKAISQFETLNAVKPYYIHSLDVYKENTKTQVLTKEKNVAQAEIMQIFNYVYNDTPKEYAMNAILRNLMTSSSIGLFTVLREKEHLAYRVDADAYNRGNCGEFSCYISTTTDNKENGEISYDNVQKSINGFNRQIKALLNSEYTNEDLENAKRALKASLLIKETTNSKLNSVSCGLNNAEGTEFLNKVYEEIDKLTRGDIQKYAEYIFKNPPIYSIVATKDTLDANKDFFETL